MFGMRSARTRISIGATAFLLLFSLAACSRDRAPAIEEQAQLPLRQPEGLVSDFARKLSSNTKQEIEALLRNFADRSGIDVAVVTIPFADMQGLPIEEYSLTLGRGWGIGRGPEKLGLLLLIAIEPADAAGLYHGGTRLEVSRNLERDISNELAGQIIRTMRDDFQAGRFDQAIRTGVELILATLSEKRGIPN